MKRFFGMVLAGSLLFSACTSKPHRSQASKTLPSPTASAPTAPGRIAFVSSERGFGPAGGPSAIEIIDETGANRRVVYRSEMTMSSLAWSPDRSRFALTESGDEFSPPGGLWIVKADGADAHRIRSEGYGPAWSPKGDLIAFSKYVGTRSGLFLIRPDGTGERRLTTCSARCANDVGDGSPSWSPDGKRIAFQRGHEIWIVDADGSHAHALTKCSSASCYHASPAWSPDGTRIAFIAGSGTLWVVRPDGTTLRRQYACQGRSCVWVSNPAWSPDGKTILFTGFVLGGRSGQIMTLTLGESLRTLTVGPPSTCCAVWEPASA
jgi:Tol biopolymer transport system component